MRGVGTVGCTPAARKAGSGWLPSHLPVTCAPNWDGSAKTGQLRWAGAKAGDKRSGYTLLRDSTTVEAIMDTSAAAIQIHCVPCAWNFSPRTT